MIKVNHIVRVNEGVANGNKPGTIVKVLSKPGRLPDNTALISTSLYSNRLSSKVLCEAINHLGSNTLNNKPVCYEFISDLIPATKEEKTYRKQHNNK